MAKTKSAGIDRFGNYYKTQVATSAADTLTFQEWPTGFSIKDGFAFVIHKIRYRIPGISRILMTSTGDYINAAVCTNNLLTTTAMLRAGNDANILDSCVITRDIVTAVGVLEMDEDIIHDFTNEPGGGRIIAPKPLYLALMSFGLGQVAYCHFEITYTTLKMNAEAYREIFESMHPSA